MHPNLLHRHAHADCHVVKERRVTLVAGVGVARNVGRPLVLGGVGVTGADELVLEGFELLLGAQFVGLENVSRMQISGLDRLTMIVLWRGGVSC